MDASWIERARQLDATDPLQRYREEFCLPPGIYLDGNSLGAASRRALQALGRAAEQWRQLGVQGWSAAEPPWFTLCEELARRSAFLVGAASTEVAVTNSTTINLHQLVGSFYAPQGHRSIILADELNFPSDLYALAGQLRGRGLEPADHLRLVPSRDGRVITEEDIMAQITPEVALVMLSSVLYRSGQLLDIPGMVRAAHRQGATIGWDLSHSVGVIPHQLSDWDVDFAFWCNYKYVNGGPGAPAGLFVHTRHADRWPSLPGWWGSDKEVQFAMEPTFCPAPDAGRWQVGTPPVLSAAPLLGALELLGEVGVQRLRTKSLSLTAFLMELADACLTQLGFAVATPRQPQRRGGHVALEHADGWQLTQGLLAQDTVVDFRPPQTIRLAPVPLYNTHEELCRVVQQLEELVSTGAYRHYPARRGTVT